MLTIALLAATVFANAQIKVHSDNQISIGSLDKTYGLQVHPDGYTYFTNPNTFGSIVTMTYVNSLTRSWVVKTLSSVPITLFYVDGFGSVYSYSTLIMSNPNSQSFINYIDNPSNTLNQISGFYYTMTNKENGEKPQDKVCVGFSAPEIAKVIPEAVEIDDEDNMFINYNVLTVFLVEAVKEQQQEILELRKTLKDNGLMK